MKAHGSGFGGELVDLLDASLDAETDGETTVQGWPNYTMGWNSSDDKDEYSKHFVVERFPCRQCIRIVELANQNIAAVAI